MGILSIGTSCEFAAQKDIAKDLEFGGKDNMDIGKCARSLNAKYHSLAFSALYTLRLALSTRDWPQLWSHCSKNSLPTKALTVHSFFEALPMPDLSRLSQSSSSGGEVRIFPVFASRMRTKTLDVCIARYCRNLRVAGSSRLMFAHMKLRASEIAWVRRRCPLEDPLWWFTPSSLAFSNWKYGMNPCDRCVC